VKTQTIAIPRLDSRAFALDHLRQTDDTGRLFQTVMPLTTKLRCSALFRARNIRSEIIS